MDGYDGLCVKDGGGSNGLFGGKYVWLFVDWFVLVELGIVDW